MSRLSCSHNSLKSILKKQEGEDLGKRLPEIPTMSRGNHSVVFTTSRAIFKNGSVESSLDENKRKNNTLLT